MNTVEAYFKRKTTFLEVMTSWLYTTSFAFHMLVPLVYWSSQAKQPDLFLPNFDNFLNLSRHGLDFLVMCIEFLCNKVLVQWGHLVISYVILLLYLLFAWFGAYLYPDEGYEERFLFDL